MSRFKHWRQGCTAIGVSAVMLALSAVACAQLRIGVGTALPSSRIGIVISAYPQLVPVPGYPVYYAPNLDTNLFFYDGYYWLFTDGGWYYSTWYDGPWYFAEPLLVPVFLLRIPILYYRHPPMYFSRWNRYGPPRWGEHWGRTWERQRPGWDRWNRNAVPPRAPLPTYQRHYPRSRYPDLQQRRTLENRFYHYEPRESRLREGQPRQAQPRQVQPRQAQPRQAQPRQVQPRQVQPRQVQPRQAQPRQAQPRQAQPREARPRQVQPRQAQPRQVQPRQVQPRQVQPRQAQPREARPRQAQPHQGRSQPRFEPHRGPAGPSRAPSRPQKERGHERDQSRTAFRLRASPWSLVAPATLSG